VVRRGIMNRERAAHEVLWTYRRGAIPAGEHLEHRDCPEGHHADCCDPDHYLPSPSPARPACRSPESNP
jgi:hypothetical protein